MFNKLINSFKQFGRQIDQLENNVSGERDKFMEVFERNLILEKEIVDRTEELSQANKSILTLKHIWSTMNSSEPLSAVLNTIVQGLTEEMGYLHGLIFQIYENNGEKVLKIRISNNNEISSKIQKIIGDTFEDEFHIPIEQGHNIIINSINTKKITRINTFSDLLENGSVQLDDTVAFELNKLFRNRSISIIPINSQENPFGALIVVSIRNEISDTENNFLSLLAGQIELAVTIAHLFETIREQAITDALTGIYNRRHFEKSIALEAKRSKRLNQPFTLVTLDLDHLKFINDTYGHSAGDAAIAAIGEVLKNNARSIDVPARFGGEEFGIVLPGIDVEGGLIAAERIRSAIEEQHVESVGTITASVGVATFLKHTNDPYEILELCDQAMYKAKRNGRNQVQLAEKTDQPTWQQLALDTFIAILSDKHIPIDKKVAKDLSEKLKTTSVNSPEINDILYFVVDTFTNSYDPLHKIGSTKDQVELSVKLAGKLELPDEEIDRIRMATLLYDIGNMLMPESILLKPGPLDEDEKKTIIEHPMIAAREILKPINSANHIIPIVEHHHENWDGSGYPNQLSGDQIPIGSRIIVIVDAYFALINDRSYRKAYSQEEAVKILKDGANNRWDGHLIEIFTKLLEKEVKSI